MSTSPHSQAKGCGLCKPHKHRASGQAARKPWAELRQIGKVRRVSRHDIGDWSCAAGRSEA